MRLPRPGLVGRILLAMAVRRGGGRMLLVTLALPVEKWCGKGCGHET